MTHGMSVTPPLLFGINSAMTKKYRVRLTWAVGITYVPILLAALASVTVQPNTGSSLMGSVWLVAYACLVLGYLAGLSFLANLAVSLGRSSIVWAGLSLITAPIGLIAAFVPILAISKSVTSNS